MTDEAPKAAAAKAAADAAKAAVASKTAADAAASKASADAAAAKAAADTRAAAAASDAADAKAKADEAAANAVAAGAAEPEPATTEVPIEKVYATAISVAAASAKLIAKKKTEEGEARRWLRLRLWRPRAS